MAPVPQSFPCSQTELGNKEIVHEPLKKFRGAKVAEAIFASD
jgi:hypothetical protein